MLSCGMACGADVRLWTGDFVLSNGLGGSNSVMKTTGRWVVSRASWCGFGEANSFGDRHTE